MPSNFFVAKALYDASGDLLAKAALANTRGCKELNAALLMRKNLFGRLPNLVAAIDTTPLALRVVQLQTANRPDINHCPAGILEHTKALCKRKFKANIPPMWCLLEVCYDGKAFYSNDGAAC